jgi:type VI protein secretion system component VasF
VTPSRNPRALSRLARLRRASERRHARMGRVIWWGVVAMVVAVLGALLALWLVGA